MNTEYNQLVGISDELDASATPRGWSGDAASKARTHCGNLVDTGQEWAFEIGAVRPAAGDVADAVTGVQHGAEEAKSLASAHRMTISDNGTVTDPGPPMMLAPEEWDRVAAERAAIKQELETRIKQVLRQAADIDADFVAVLERVSSGQADASGQATEASALGAWGNTCAIAGSLSILAPPPEGATAAQNAAYWDTLSQAQRDRLTADRPALIGNRDGIPTVYRDRANRELLGRERTRLQDKLTELEQTLSESPGGPGSDLEESQLNDQIKAVEGKLQGIADIHDRLEQNADLPPDKQYYLLGIDGSGDGQAIIAKGNPDTAANVTTYVPGTGSDLAGIDSGVTRSDRMFHAAEKYGSDSTSVITWYGYDAPDAIPNAASNDYAEDSVADLDSFQDGLQASREDTAPPAHSTVLGHSYGSTVVGLTAQQEGGLATDELVLVGSPGVEADHASALNMPQGHVWATADPDDPVAEAPGLGIDPTEDSFGARGFKADAPGEDGKWYQGGYNVATHSDYWEPGNPSLRGIGHIIADTK